MSKERRITNDTIDFFCKEYCVCVRFDISEELEERLKKEIKSKEYKKKFKDELNKTKVKATCETKLGTFRPKKKERKRIFFATSISPSNKHLSEEDLHKCFPIFQKRVDHLRQYGIKEFEATICAMFGFRLKRFKLVGEFVLPVKLSLRPQLAEKLGGSRLEALGITFEESPLGLEKVLLFVDEEEDALFVYMTSSFKTSLEGVVKNAFLHGKKISTLFVEEKQ